MTAARRGPDPAVGPAPASARSTLDDHVRGEIEALAAGRHTNPHQVLGVHGDVVRAWRPDAVSVELVVLPDDKRVPMEKVHPAGVFEARASGVSDYRLDITYQPGNVVPGDDPYRFWPTVGDFDLYLFGEGRHETLWRVMGAHVREHQSVTGTSFAVWAPPPRRCGWSETSTAGTVGCTRCACSDRRACGSCSCPASARGATTSSS